MDRYVMMFWAGDRRMRRDGASIKRASSLRAGRWDRRTEDKTFVRNDCDRGRLDPCANSYLGRGLEAGHGLGQDLLLARRERAVAASRSSTSLGRGGSRAVLGVVRFACHVEKMQRGKRIEKPAKNLISERLCRCLCMCTRDVDGECGRLQVWRGEVARDLKSKSGRSVQLTARSPANSR